MATFTRLSWHSKYNQINGNLLDVIPEIRENKCYVNWLCPFLQFAQWNQWTLSQHKWQYLSWGAWLWPFTNIQHQGPRNVIPPLPSRQSWSVLVWALASSIETYERHFHNHAEDRCGGYRFADWNWYRLDGTLLATHRFSSENLYYWEWPPQG
jgi:hypothetical protein